MNKLLLAAGNNLSAIARTCNITPQAVHKWVVAGEVPLKRVPELCKAYGLTPHDLRPDIFRRKDSGLRVVQRVPRSS